MVELSRLLSRAIKTGESALRSALRDMQSRRGEIQVLFAIALMTLFKHGSTSANWIG
jgi:hypothetical protein